MAGSTRFNTITTLCLERDKAIQCHFPGCRRPVFRQVFVVYDPLTQGFGLYGGECHRKLYDLNETDAINIRESTEKLPRSAHSEALDIDYDANFDEIISKLSRDELRGLAPLNFQKHFDKFYLLLLSYGVRTQVVERLKEELSEALGTSGDDITS